MNLFIPEADTFKTFLSSKDTNSISDNRIYVIAETSDSTIWIGTKGGLNKYLGNDNFKRITADNHELPNNVI